MFELTEGEINKETRLFLEEEERFGGVVGGEEGEKNSIFRLSCVLDLANTV